MRIVTEVRSALHQKTHEIGEGGDDNNRVTMVVITMDSDD